MTERFPGAFAFRSACCNGEKCLRCGAPADGKIEEVIFDDDPVQMRHPFTAYLCKPHLRETLIANLRVPEVIHRGEHHWRDGWFFSRRHDGTVRVRIRGGDPVFIPPGEWASIVAWVAGDYTGSHEAAMQLHRLVPRPPTDHD